MSVPAGENIYNTYGTVLYRVIDELQHALEMGGATRFRDDTTDGDIAAKTSAGNDATTATTANLSTQKNVLAAAAAAVASSSHSKRKPVRLDPISSQLRTTTAVHAAPPSAATLGGMSTTKIAPVPNQSAIGSYQLTAEKALAQIFAPTDLYADRGEPTEEGDATWVKVAALDHVSRVNVVQLFQHLQKRCADEHARPRGVLCPTREAIFNDGMREVMRQVSVLCPERGLLLNDLLQQMAQNTITYDVLAENASQYAVRKSTERDLRRHLFTERSELESEVRRIENRVNELRAKYSGLQKRFEEQKEANLSLREEEVVYIKKANQQIINEIKRLSNLEAATSAA